MISRYKQLPYWGQILLCICGASMVGILLVAIPIGSGASLPQKSQPSAPPSPTPTKPVYGVVDTDSKCYDDCYIPIMTAPAAVDNPAATLNIAAYGDQTHPNCNVIATSGCWPRYGEVLKVFCETKAMAQRDRWGDMQTAWWYYVELPAAHGGKQVWLKPNLGKKTSNGVGGWINAAYLMPFLDPQSIPLKPCKGMP